jgi:hypothetical protein
MTSKIFVRSSVLFCALLLASTGCGRLAASARHDDSPPPNVKGAPMEPMPTTRQQAQDAVYRYYQKTLRELPEGYALDNSSFGSVGATVSACDEYGTVQNPNDTARYDDARFVVMPPGANHKDFVVKVGDIWKSWGWRVDERKGFNKPNRFGVAPDGYTLKAEVADDDPLKYPVNFSGISPCFKGGKDRDAFIPIATVITRDDLIYQEPSTTPTR